MIHSIVKFAEIVAATGTICGIAYNLLCWWSAAVFLRQRRSAPEDSGMPPVSILKPLKGIDPEMYESFRSHCLQHYPAYEIIFGVSDANDPSLEMVNRLIAEFPQLNIRVVVSNKILGANIKISNLAHMFAAAKYGHLVVNDSDIRVEPEYLRRVVSPLHDPANGLVTCLYRGVPAATLGSRLESLSISTDFCAGVLVARMAERAIRFGLGSTLAFRRSDLEAIGGFESFVDYLADDYELGNRMSKKGLNVVLSGEVVETYVPAYTLLGYLRHQLRWVRTVRASRFWGFSGLIFTFALPWAVLAVVFFRGAFWAWILLAIAGCVRLATSLVVGRRVLKDENVLQLAWLIPLRDFLGVFVWMASFFGNTVVWRGDRFKLSRGKLTRLNTWF